MNAESEEEGKGSWGTLCLTLSQLERMDRFSLSRRVDDISIIGAMNKRKMNCCELMEWLG